MLASKFWQTVLSFTPPAWTTENRIVFRDDAVILRRFQDDASSAVPWLILPPQAGHHSCICDYGPGQSLVRVFMETGAPVFAVEWLSCTYARRKETINDLIEQVDRCVESAGGKVHLVGLCQSGWLSAIFAALHPSKVETLTIAAAPIDTHAGGGMLQRMVHAVPTGFYEWMVALNRGIMPGRNMLSGFKLLNWYGRFIDDFQKLLVNIESKSYVDRYTHFRNWYEHTQDIAGAWYLWAVKELFKENNLIKEKLFVGGKRVSLKSISCPVTLIVGQNDDLTLPEQVFNMEHYVSGPVTKILIPKTGHIGCFMKKGALAYWRRFLEGDPPSVQPQLSIPLRIGDRETFLASVQPLAIRCPHPERNPVAYA